MKAAIISEIAARQAGAAASPVAAVVKAVDPKLIRRRTPRRSPPR